MRTKTASVLLWLIFLSAAVCAAQATQCVVRPANHGRALVNPQMGWTFHHYSNIIRNYGSRLEPSDTLDNFPGLSAVYLRLPWSFIEPEEGVFNWSIVDTPAQRWIARGKQVAFRFSCTESWLRYATPKWVQDEGAKGYNFTPGKLQEDGPYWEPDYGDPVFLQKLDHFLAAAAARYDGNPNVAFIDVGSFGVWGEGHTYHSTRKKYSPDVLKRHIDLHVKHFKRTLLAANDDFASQEGNVDQNSQQAFAEGTIIRYAFEKGLTLRDDSILVQKPPNHYFHADMAQMFWPRLPVVLECEHYGSSRDRGAWGDGSKYLHAVEDYHACYASIHWWPEEFLREQKELIDRINRRLGYRLELREISWPGQVEKGRPFAVGMEWSNVGVAPCYPGGYVALTLKDDKAGIVAVLVDESFDVRSLKVEPADAPVVHQVATTFDFARNMSAGIFDVCVSVGLRDGTPVIALPLEDSDGKRRYKLGKIEVKGSAD